MKHKAISRAADGARFTIRQWRIGRRVILHLVGFLIVASLLAYLGPFGTWDDLAFVDRLAFWAIAVGVNWLCSNFVFPFTIRHALAWNWPPGAGVALAALIAAVPGTGAVWLAVAAYLDYQPFTFPALVELYAEVAVIQLVVGFLVSYFIEKSFDPRTVELESSSGGGRLRDTMPGRGGSRVAGANPRADAPVATRPASALLARLPTSKQGDVHHLRMQDHYVEVHTEKGMEMLLLRFRDALREVEDIEGMQVHRSHWVARAAVEGVERRDGRVTLRLRNGSRVPVSRSFAPALRARGWM